MGRHDTYGSALTAQPGESQRRPATNASSQLIEYIGLPTLRAPGASVPDGRTICRDRFDPSRTLAPAILIPVTNAIEALNAKLRRAVKIRGHFPNDEAATKLIYLVLRQTATEWKMSPREWGEAKTQFAIMFEDRFILA